MVASLVRLNKAMTKFAEDTMRASWTMTEKQDREHTATRTACWTRCAIVNAESLVIQIESLEEIFRLVLVGNGLFSLHAPAMDAVVVEVVAEERGKQRGRGSGSWVSTRPTEQREMMARDTRQELVQCVQTRSHGTAHMHRRKSVVEERWKSDTSSLRRTNIIQPCPVREVHIGAGLTAIRCDLVCRGTDALELIAKH